MIFRFIGDTFMGRRWWQKEARRIQNHRAKPRLGTTTEQADVEEINDEVAADAIDELNETLADTSNDDIVNELSSSEDESVGEIEEDTFESTDISEDIVSDDVVEEAVTPTVVGTFNQNNNTFKKKKRR